jgi:hypothetical protein
LTGAFSASGNSIQQAYQLVPSGPCAELLTNPRVRSAYLGLA